MERTFTAQQYGHELFNDFSGLATFLGLTDYDVFEKIVKPAFMRGFVDHGDYRIYATTTVQFYDSRVPNFVMNLRVVLRERKTDA